MAIIFALSSIAYVLLRSPLWSGDGVRWLDVALAPTFPKDGGGNRHFLFPYLAWVVYHTAAHLPLSWTPDDPTRSDAVAIVQGWNAIMAGAGLALLYAWLRCLVSRSAAAVGVTFVALSNAFLLHATNMTEPMASVPPALFALLLVTRSGSTRGARLAAGGLIGLASAFYILSAQELLPVMLIGALRGVASPTRRRAIQSVLRGAEVGAASAVIYTATLSIPRLVAHPQGDVIGTVVGVSDAQMHGMYGGFHLRHLIGAFGGLANAICALPQMYGFSQLFRLPLASVLRTFATLAFTLALVLGVTWSLRRARPRLVADGRWVDVIASATWFMTVYFAAFYFLAGYDKIWFFAMFPAAALVAFAFDVRQEETNSLTALRIVAPGLVLVVLNLLLLAIPRRFAHNVDLDSAERIAAVVRPTDLLVSHGWDAPSVYVGYALSHPLDCFRLTAQAMGTGFNAPEVSHRLSSEVRRVLAAGGHVYFLGLIDSSPPDWQAFNGSELHLPYDLLDPYRHAALPRGTFPSSAGPVTLFEFVGDAR